MSIDASRALAMAQDCLDTEIAALQRVKSRLSSSLVQAVELILNTPGRVVVTGMGKSGHVARKIAATLASTGTAAMFVHPAEASHGDLGMITGQDLVVGISNSGEVNELTVLLPLVKRLGVKLVAITGGAQSSLAQMADVVLDSSVEREACPLNLAPTASTTAQMALGDALAMALLDARGFQAEDFARSHPGGALGRKLLTHVKDIMRRGHDVPRVLATASFDDLMAEMSAKGMGASAVTDEAGQVLGIFTDGDLRRLISHGMGLRGLTAQEVMHSPARTIDENALAAEAAELMERHRITGVLVVGAGNRLTGALNSHDLMHAKVI
ncbi:arabinose-5-phosphate isomerase [Comamonas serinivorans]|uniref:Arabinose-5-phosphate isomerase n=1 Tax=Comamonas serinivorans TaxID=1082851 RepID=A0A1Y0EJ63_9BURK|nr:KpsF/GutQ family sugar-phosphate isomerase [Comamonas serinivorans]ARU03312.1 arabinose-5-phosphate isomerase [Comamonas serinivorans]